MNVDTIFEGDYQCFLDDEFDAEKYANTIIASSAVSQTLQSLKLGVEKLDCALEDHVSEHYEDLINQATGMDILEESLSVVKSRIDQLQRAASSVKKRISEPYEQMNIRTQQLGRLQKTCDILRRVTRIQYLSKRLKQQIEGGVKEITKTSQTLNELQYLYGESGDLIGIELVDRDLEWITKAKENMEQQAELLLKQGLSSLNQNQTSTALQVFNSIGTLQSVVSDLVTTKCNCVQQGFVSALSGSFGQSHKGQGGNLPGGANIGNTAAWRASFWTSLDKWSNSVTSDFNELHVLQRTLARRRDPATQQCLLKESGATPLVTYVSAVHSTLQQEFRTVSSSAKHALNMEYPKALRLVVGLWEHFNSKLDVEGLEGVTLPKVNVRDVLTTYQCTYLSRSLNRLLDPVNIAFPGKSVPSTNDIESIVRIMCGELAAARGDTELRKLSTNNIVKATRDIVNKCENLVQHGSMVNDVTSTPNQYQSKNIQVINALCALYKKVGDLPTDVSGVMSEVWDLIVTALNSILGPFRIQIEGILNSMHGMDYGVEKQDISGCSPYILLVEEAVNHLASNYLSLLSSSRATLQPLILQFQDSLLLLYLHHLCVVRPLGEGGKMKLATDIAEIERVFGALIEEGGSKQFKVLRAFRAVLFLTVEDLITVRNVPKPILLNHMFSRAGESLLSPNKVAGWTKEQYVAWLYSHPHEILDMVQGTVQWYEGMIRESGAKQFDPIHPTLIKLMEIS